MTDTGKENTDYAHRYKSNIPLIFTDISLLNLIEFGVIVVKNEICVIFNNILTKFL